MPEVCTEVEAWLKQNFILPVIRIADNNELFAYLRSLKEKYPGFITAGTTAHKETPLYSVDFTVPLMLMLGNETMGLNKAFKEYCDVLCTIPMAETSYASSFNVSCAASILMYEVTRQRGEIGGNRREPILFVIRN